MPAVFRRGNVRFHFYSNEGSPREPAHAPADGPDGEAKFRLSPDVAAALGAGYNRRRLAELAAMVRQRRGDVERAWNGHFSQSPDAHL